MVRCRYNGWVKNYAILRGILPRRITGISPKPHEEGNMMNWIMMAVLHVIVFLFLGVAYVAAIALFFAWVILHVVALAMLVGQMGWQMSFDVQMVIGGAALALLLVADRQVKVLFLDDAPFWSGQNADYYRIPRGWWEW